MADLSKCTSKKCVHTKKGGHCDNAWCGNWWGACFVHNGMIKS